MAVVMTSSPIVSIHSFGDLFVVMPMDTFSCRALIKWKKLFASFRAMVIVMMSSITIK